MSAWELIQRILWQHLMPSSHSVDNVDTLAAHGVTAIIQPGGSVRDDESIAACDEYGIAMVFTGKRHFRH